jgi:hypothetical protein
MQFSPTSLSLCFSRNVRDEVSHHQNHRQNAFINKLLNVAPKRQKTSDLQVFTTAPYRERQ